MTITKGQINGIWYELFQPTVKSDNWLIWEHGIGEESSVNDGSQLQKEEIPGVWLTAARNGFEFPFNIIAPQINTGSDWWHLTNGNPGNESWFVNWVKESLGAKMIGATGYSLGGRGMWNLLKYDTRKYLSFIAPICGYYDFSQGSIDTLRTVPVYGVHGDADPTMKYSYDVATQLAYNSTRPNQVIAGVSQPAYYLVTIPGAGHSVWPIAYDTTFGKDGLLQWVLQQFGPVPTNYPVTFSFNGIDIIATSNGQSWKVAKS